MAKPDDPIVIHLISQDRKLKERLSSLAAAYER